MPSDHISAPSKPIIPFKFVDRPGLGRISIINFLLSIVTLGIYYFWGKTNIRKHLWSNIRFENETLEYTGTGKEIFLGFLVVFFLVLLPISLINIAAQLYFGEGDWRAVSIQAIIVILFLYLMNVGIYRARRYRLSRTLWRGIRGTMNGSSWRYAGYAFLLYLLIPLSLGFAYPWINFKLYQRLYSETEFGNRSFNFEGTARGLYKVFLMNALWFLLTSFIVGLVVAGLTFLVSPDLPMETFAAILMVPFIGFGILFSIRYRARELNYIASCVSFEGADFTLYVRARGLIGIAFLNMLITIFSLGIAAPFALRNVMRYFVNHLDIFGTIDYEAIAQSQRALDSTGEGLAEAFDIDGF